MKSLYQRLMEHPVIAAVKEEDTLKAAIASECEVIFLLTGNICTLDETARMIRQTDKAFYIHFDLMEGFARDRHSVQYIKERIAPDGIITTRSNLVKNAKEIGLPAIQRMFMIDNLSFKTGIQSIRQIKPQAVEILPGLMPSVTKKICGAVTVPVITGGLINEKDEIIASLNAGAVGVSTSNTNLWSI